MLDPRRLRVLVAVVDRGSFTAAAASLAYTQSAVSQSIARLEAEAGVPLLRRGRAGVTPTDAGRMLYRHGRRILDAVADAEAELGAFTGRSRRRLRVASFASGGAALVPLAVARLRRAHPDVALTLLEGDPAEVIPRLRDGELDLGLLFDFAAGDAGGRRASLNGLRTTVLLDDPMDLVLPAGHRLAARPAVRLADLSDESWVQPGADGACARHVVACCAAAGFAPDVASEADDYGTVVGLVAAGVGVALVPRLAYAPGRPGTVVRALHPASPVRRVLVALPSSAPPSPAARAMVSALTEIARRHAPA